MIINVTNRPTGFLGSDDNARILPGTCVVRDPNPATVWRKITTNNWLDLTYGTAFVPLAPTHVYVIVDILSIDVKER